MSLSSEHRDSENKQTDERVDVKSRSAVAIEREATWLRAVGASNIKLSWMNSSEITIDAYREALPYSKQWHIYEFRKTIRKGYGDEQVYRFDVDLAEAILIARRESRKARRRARALRRKKRKQVAREHSRLGIC